MQMKRTIAVLLAVCFLMSVTVAVVSAKELPDIAGKKADKPADKAEKITEKKIMI